MTPIAPVTVVAGTVTASWVEVAAVTVAFTVQLGPQANVTVFWLGVGLKPVPAIVTVAPPAPLAGVNPLMDTTVVPGRSIAVMLPTGSYR